MEIRHNDIKSHSDEKKPRLMAKKVSLQFCLANIFCGFLLCYTEQNFPSNDTN